jgi:FkbM family methyltransferase
MLMFTLRNLFVRDPKKRARRKLAAIKLTKADTAIDCGANVGKVTRRLAKGGATVYAFEPNSHAFDILEEAFHDEAHVQCIRKAVSDENGTMRLYLHENSDEDEVHWSTGSSLLGFKGNVLKDKFEEVEVVDLCEFIVSLGRRIKILKIDIEGAECSVLKKLIDTGIINNIDYVFVETHDHKIPELKAATDEIREMIKDKKIRNIDLNWK